jgi:hypothetical protein
MTRSLLTMLLLAALAWPTHAQAAPRVSRPRLPDPMPQIIAGACPGLEDEAVGCHIGIGIADVYGHEYAHGAVFVDGYRFTTYHELGHAFNDTMMDAGERNRFASLLDRPDEAWSATYIDEQGRLIQDPRSLDEVFADAYANCRMGRVVASGHVWEAGYDYYPTAREHRLACRMLARAGRSEGTPVAVDGWR